MSEELDGLLKNLEFIRERDDSLFRLWEDIARKISAEVMREIKSAHGNLMICDAHNKGTVCCIDWLTGSRQKELEYAIETLTRKVIRQNEDRRARSRFC